MRTQADSNVSLTALPGASVAARIERLPFTPFHARALTMIGMAHFFDAFDALAIAFVLPALIIAWKMDPAQAGVLVAAGYFGQAVGSVTLGWAAERWGRLRVVAAACWIISIFSLGGALAWSALSLMVLRFMQGIGLGGEVPAGATYVNEICPARLRGRMVYGIQILFGAASAFTAGVAAWMVPRYGWQSMFIAGGLPLLMAPLLRRVLPESPRWLAGHGQALEAGLILDRVEAEYEAKRSKSLPPVPTKDVLQYVVASGDSAGFSSLLSPEFLRRTLSVWTVTFCLSFATYGILVWMPTVYTTVFKLPVQQALTYGAAGNATALIGAIIGAFLVDRLGRRTMFTLALLASSVPMLTLAWFATEVSALQVAILATTSFGFLAILLPAIYVYAPEIYPTRIRGIGAGCALAWMRIAAIVGPLLIGTLLKSVGVGAAFSVIGLLPLVGGVTIYLFGIETKGKPLDAIDPTNSVSTTTVASSSPAAPV